jgi:hypothetical protein
MIPGSGRCHYHPERVGLGICVECRRVICLECTTQFEGINRCSKCLEKRLSAVTKGPSDRKEWGFGNLFLALIMIAALFGSVVLVATIATGG